MNRNGFIISTLANTGVIFMDTYLQNTEARKYTHTHTHTHTYSGRTYLYISTNKRSILIFREVYWNCRTLVRYMAYLYDVNSDCGRLSSSIWFWQQTEFHICIRKRTVEEQSSYTLGLWLYSMCTMMKVFPSHCTSSRSLVHVWLPSVKAVKLTCALWLWSHVFFAYDWRFRMQTFWVQGWVITD
jgi:hypothetical protein